MALCIVIPVARLVQLGWSDGGWSNYSTVFTDAARRDALWTTFVVAALTTVFVLLIGYPYAYLMNKARTPVALLLLLLVLIPLWTSTLVRTYTWQFLLRDTGLINQVLMGMGIADEPMTLIRTRFAVVVGTVYVMLPYMVLLLLASFRRIDLTLVQAAKSLGAPPRRAFTRVFLPLSMPGVLAGSLVVFVLSLGFYITPALLGGPRDEMLSQTIAREVSRGSDWGPAAGMGIVLLVVTLLVLGLASRLVRMRDVFGVALENEG